MCVFIRNIRSNSKIYSPKTQTGTL